MSDKIEPFEDPETVGQRLVQAYMERMAKQLSDYMMAPLDGGARMESYDSKGVFRGQAEPEIACHSYVDGNGVRHPLPEPRPSIQLDRLLSAEFLYEDTLDAEFIYVR